MTKTNQQEGEGVKYTLTKVIDGMEVTETYEANTADELVKLVYGTKAEKPENKLSDTPPRPTPNPTQMSNYIIKGA